METYLEYNSERESLIIPEYGRHVQKMINHAIKIKDREERNKVSKAIISVMGNLNPHLRDVPDFQHKLWDQLFIMSRFQIDVDSPYEKPSQKTLQERPKRLKYPQNNPKYRFYGNNIKTMIDIALTWEDGEMKDALIYVIANHMKKCFLNWNKDTVEDSVIFEHLNELSGGKINLTPEDEILSNPCTLMVRKKKSYTNGKGKGHFKNNHSQNRNKNR